MTKRDRMPTVTRRKKPPAKDDPCAIVFFTFPSCGVTWDSWVPPLDRRGGLDCRIGRRDSLLFNITVDY